MRYLSTFEQLEALVDFIDQRNQEAEIESSISDDLETNDSILINQLLDRLELDCSPGKTEDFMSVANHLHALNRITNPSRQSATELVASYLDSWLGLNSWLGEKEMEFKEFLDEKLNNDLKEEQND